jgi:DNA-binding response OmpR family regulator
MDLNLGKLKSSDMMERIREISPDSKVLIISGVSPDLDNLHFLEKPFKLDELREKVREILDEP